MICTTTKTDFQTRLECDKIYTPAEIGDALSAAGADIPTIRTNRGVYLNAPFAFDVEVSSFYTVPEREKRACMYAWMLGLNGVVVMGRTWEEWEITMAEVMAFYRLGEGGRRLPLYVHNLAYEFQFLCHRHQWESIFALDTRKPVKALTAGGIEYRCSYVQSGYSLAKVGDNLQKYKVKKMSGDLDYKKVRHSKTPLTTAEIGYCVNDVKVVMAYIQERIEEDGDITRLPLTNTGYVRRFCKNSCYQSNTSHRGKEANKKYRDYKTLMKALSMEPDEYQQLKRAFQGGFTHASPYWANMTIEDVTSIDFTSSYPATMVAEMFPMSSARVIPCDNLSEKEFEHYLSKYCCLFDLEITGLEASTHIEHPLSASRCWRKENAQQDNGRIVRADKVLTTCTEQDFFIYKKFYTFASYRVANLRVYMRSYLPTDFVKAILKLYGDKTTLKDVAGMEVEYLHSKGMLNACFGMAVTDPLRDIITFSTESGWKSEHANLYEEIEKHNNSKNRFLFYAWGVWVTAYARRNLFTGILEFGTDYIYSDTDSIKGKNYEAHLDYINKYNEWTISKMERACKFHGLDPSVIRPKTIKGKEKPLGVWDYDGHYKRFKTLGAKRYMVEYDSGEISLTVSGCNKKDAIPYLLDKYGADGIFDAFAEGFHVPAGHAGRHEHCFIDEETFGVVVDYLGNSAEYHEYSAIHIEETSYTMNNLKDYIDYISGLRCDFR